MGDATGVYTGLDSGAVIPNTDTRVVSRVTNWAQCQNARGPGMSCYSQGDSGWGSQAALKPWWGPETVCANNYIFNVADDAGLTGKEGTWYHRDGSPADPGYHLMSNVNLRNQRQSARAFR
jgi:hypothetical protein